MQQPTTSSKPSITRLIVVNYFNTVGLVVAMVLLWPLTLISTIAPPWSDPSPAGQIFKTIWGSFTTIAPAFFGAALLGLLQAIILREFLKPWISQTKWWFGAHALAFPPLLFGVIWLAAQFVPNLSGCFRVPTDPLPKGDEVLRVFKLGGLLTGLAGGLLWGLVQGALLSTRRRVWWLLNAFTWAAAVGVITWDINVFCLPLH